MKLDQLKTKIHQESPQIMLYKEELLSVMNEINSLAEQPITSDYVSTKETIVFVKTFLNKLSADYLECFENVDLFVEEKKTLEGTFLEYLATKEKDQLRSAMLFLVGNRAYKDNKKQKFCIDLEINHTIQDALVLIHEFMHTVSGYHEEERLLDEVQPILSEFFLAKFLVTNNYFPKEEVEIALTNRMKTHFPKNPEFYNFIKLLNNNDSIDVSYDEDSLKKLTDRNINHLIGLHYALNLLNTNRDYLDLLTKLNYIKSQYGDIRYLACVRDLIKDCPKKRVMKKENQ